MGWFSRAPKEDSLEQHFKKLDEARAALKQERLAIIRRMPVIDKMRAEVLHTPIYDCASDQFELPCAYEGFRWSSRTHGIGPMSAEETERLADTTHTQMESEVLVECPDSIVFMRTDSLREPGSSVTRCVRIAPDTWFSYWWRTGMRPSAGAVDPPFFVQDIAADPSKWLARERECLARCAVHPEFKSLLASCEHR